MIHRKPLNNISGKPLILLLRGFLGALAILSSFYIVIYIGLAEAITYQQSYPIFLAFISVLFLKTKMNKEEWLAIIGGFVGTCLIFAPNLT